MSRPNGSSPFQQSWASLSLTMAAPTLFASSCFRKQDEANKVGAAIVSERLAQDCWKGEDPLGRLIEIGYEEVPRFQIGLPPASAQRFSGKVRQGLQVGEIG